MITRIFNTVIVLIPVGKPCQDGPHVFGLHCLPDECHPHDPVQPRDIRARAYAIS